MKHELKEQKIFDINKIKIKCIKNNKNIYTDIICLLNKINLTQGHTTVGKKNNYRKKLSIFSYLILNKGSQNIYLRNASISINNYGKTGYMHAKD